MYIPIIGARIILNSPWTFGLVPERRNITFLEQLCSLGIVAEQDILNCIPAKTNRWGQISNKISDLWFVDSPVVMVSIPAGSVLSVSRIYIRNGNASFNSVTFHLLSTPTKKWKKARFWAKLTDANCIDSSNPIVTPSINTTIPVALL